jgi:hypothetical protein
VERGGLRIVAGGAAAEAVGASPDPAAFLEECLRAFGASQVARGFSELTIVNGSGTLQRLLDACGRPAWEMTREDVDRVVGELPAQGLAASTRGGYVQAFKNFHAFLAVRKAAEIEAASGIRLEDPVDEFNAARHVSADSPAAEPPAGPGTAGGLLRLPAGTHRRRAQVRRRRPGLRPVQDLVSRRAAR